MNAEYVDATLRDLAPLPWGASVGTEDLAIAAAALAPAGPGVLEAIDPRCAAAAVVRRAESPWDRLRAIVREVGGLPVGIVVGGRGLWGERPLAPDVVRRFVLCAAESGAARVRAHDPLNDPAILELIATAAAEAGLELVPTLVVGSVPEPTDARWLEEARELAALPGARRICLSDGAGHLSPTALGRLVGEVGTVTGLPVEVQVQAPGGLAPMSAAAAVVGGAAAVQASAGPVALVAARPSAETLRSALLGGPRELTLDAAALDRAARVVGPMLPADRLRQAAATVFGPAVAVPPSLEAGLVARLGRLGLSRLLVAVADEAAAVARDVGSATLAFPLGGAVVAQAARHVVDGRRWEGIESPELAQVALGRRGRLRGPVAEAALAAAVIADPGEVELVGLPGDSAEVADEDLVLLAQFGAPAERIVARRRSLRTEAESSPEEPAVDRELLDTMIEAVEASDEAEVSVEIAGARVTVRRAMAVAEAGSGRAAPAGDPETEGLLRVESPMVGTFYRAPAPESLPYVDEGDTVAAGQVLCLIEAMKLFNEIVADRAGVIRRICIENAEPAEFGQLLFLIEP